MICCVGSSDHTNDFRGSAARFHNFDSTYKPSIKLKVILIRDLFLTFEKYFIWGIWERLR